MIFWPSFHLFYSFEVYLEYTFLITTLIWKGLLMLMVGSVCGVAVAEKLISERIIFFVWWQFFSLEFSL